MLAGGTVLVLAGLAVGEAGRIDGEALQPGPIAAWAYLAVVGSVVGFSAYAWLLRNAPISQVVTHQYVNPLVAVVLGALLLDERPGPATLAGAALIIGAVVVTAKHEGRGAVSASDTSPDEGDPSAATAEAGERAA
jgi:drug/metabolite transporter (DMT)-like permease